MVTYASKENGSLAGPQLLVTVSYGPLGADDYVTRWTYDALSERLTEKTPTTYAVGTAQKTSTSTYDEMGAVREATDFSAVTTGTEFDRAGRATRTFEDTDPAVIAPVVTSVDTYDRDGRVLTAKDRGQAALPALGYTGTTYDSLGRAVSVTTATGTVDESLTSSSYDALDRRTVLNVGGQDTNYAFDVGGRTTSTDDGFTCATKTYDYRDLALTATSGLAGGTCSSTGTAWRTVTTSVDGLGRAYRSEQTSSSNGVGDGDRTSDDVLDAVGNRRSSATRVGGTTSTTTYTVTILDETTVEARPDGSTAKTTFDPAGNASDKCFWKAGVAVGACQVVGSVPWTNPPTQSTSAFYDARNSRIQQVDGLTNQVTTYDPSHNYLPAGVYLPTGSGRELQTLFTYDSRHRLTGVAHQSCLVAAGGSHTCSGSATALGSDSYTYDENDNRTRVVEANGATSSDTAYCYDARDELTKVGPTAGCASPTETYTYDDAGNRQSATGRSFTYTPDGQLTSCTSPACSVGYDSAGRISTYTDNGTTWSYAYDAAGRLTSACKAASCSGTGFDRLDMSYDGEGHRTRIVETPAAGSPVVTRDLAYQGDAVVAEMVNGTLVRQVVVDDAGSPTKVTITNSGSSDGTYLPTFSGHGDLLALWRLNADGTLTLANSVTYTTWGRPTVSGANGYADLGFRRLYVGRSDVWTDDTYGAGLLYMHARSYVPALGRFLQPDPAEAEGNLYGYAGNSPVTKSDPDGTFWYKVARGDTLRSLAQRYLGNAAKASLILDTNRARIPRTRATVRVGACIWIPKAVTGWQARALQLGSCRPVTLADLASYLPPGYSSSRASDSYAGLRCATGVWGGALLIAEGGSVALEGPAIFAMGGFIAVTGGIGLIAIGGVGVAAGFLLMPAACNGG
jgi:RHS repeat-associated protein